MNWEDAYRDLGFFFLWSDTSQGHSYWHLVSQHMGYNRHLSNATEAMPPPIPDLPVPENGACPALADIIWLIPWGSTPQGYNVWRKVFLQLAGRERGEMYGLLGTDNQYEEQDLFELDLACLEEVDTNVPPQHIKFRFVPRSQRRKRKH